MKSDGPLSEHGITLENETFVAKFDTGRGGFISLRCREDRQSTEYLLDPAEFPEMDIPDAKWFGHIVTRYRIGNREWTAGNTAPSSDIRTVRQRGNAVNVTYKGDSVHADGIRHFDLETDFRLEDDGLYWTIGLTNRSEHTLEFDSIGVPLLFNQIFRNDSVYKYEQNVLRHTFISEEGSYVYWARSSGKPPFLVMLTRDGTGLESTERDDRNNLKAEPGTGSPFGPYTSFDESWEGLVTAVLQGSRALILPPGNRLTYRFKLAWAQSFADIGRLAHESGQIDIEVLPGLVVPRDDQAVVLLRSTKTIHAVTASVPELTDIRDEGEQAGGYRLYRIRFHHLGENDVTIHYGDGERSVLHFFAIDTLERLITGHAAFIAEHQYETNPGDPCYHGLLMWDMTMKSRINSTCNPFGDDWWAGGSDEIGLVSGLFLSEKNVYRPDEAQLRILEAYLSDFVEERLTEQPGYRVHRMVPWHTMFEPWEGHGADDVWRAFNYVHVINTYFNMYRIQERFGYTHLRTAEDYLRQAFLYTQAMFRFWMFPDGVGATEYGNMGESTIPLYLADALAGKGMTEEAEWVRETAASKASFFTKSAYPFGSEMAYDSTAYEAVYGYAKSAGDTQTMEKAVQASFANRGHQPDWRFYNTDLRQQGETYWNVSYMTHLGGWVLYDYALNEGRADYELIKSAYASYLAGWSLINSGQWNDDPETIGSSCWVLHTGWANTKEIRPGQVPLIKNAWQMSGESSLGYFMALKMAASVVIDHPILGIYGFGCDVQTNEREWVIRPRDGVNVRIHDTVHAWSLETERGHITELRVDPYTRTLYVRIEELGQGLSDTDVKVVSRETWRVILAK
ncbi:MULTISPECIES: DUF5695 domain-containing protein [Saccharibacillus]|uniref:DUF5695 domain-containing protein n=1 Tax=Saccharibacillus TaxID=456492 RepID=UPI001239F3E4|nr:DUF5695 domain-containing protein [Saccharibacillus sp. WB 17]MWJ30521.1 hypothetical protein [Saccharibacillus sp. WB 17]